MRYFFATIGLALLSFTASTEEKLENVVMKAKEQDKMVLICFSGSDWCRPCMKFEKNVLKDSTFMAFADSNVFVYKVDFPRKDKSTKEEKKYKGELAEKYNPEGNFPKLIAMDGNSKILWSQNGYKNEAASHYINKLKELSKAKDEEAGN